MMAGRNHKNTPSVCLTHLLLISVFFLGIFFPAPAWGAVSDFRLRANINLPDGTPSYYFLEIPDEVLGQTQPGLPDLRIYCGEEEVPYALLDAQALLTSVRRERAVIKNRGVDMRGNVVFEVEVPQSRWINQIQLFSPDKNFICQVQVEGSQDGMAWVNLISDSIIFDLTKEHKNRRMEVNLPQTNFRHLRVTVLRDAKGTINIEGVEMTFVTPTAALGTVKERLSDMHIENGKDGVQEVILDLYHPNLPSREIEVVTGLKNFNRMIELYDSDNNKDWTFVTKGEVYSYQLDKLTAKQLFLPFKSNRRYIKIKINNQDNPALVFSAIKIRGVNPAIVFFADRTKEYSLYWNSNQIKPPVYDIQKFKDNLDYDKMPRALLQQEEENQNFLYKDNRPWSERNSWLLQVSLAAAAIGLLLIIVHSIRKISSDK